MKTMIPASITTLEDAKKFLTDLHNNNETYHPEDDALYVHFISIPVSERPTIDECNKLNALMNSISCLQETKTGSFDPCQFLIDLEKQDSLSK